MSEDKAQPETESESENDAPDEGEVSEEKAPAEEAKASSGKSESSSKKKSSKPPKSSGAKNGKKRSSNPPAKTKSKTKDTGADDGKAKASSEAPLKFLCVHCGHRFEEETKPARCPSCMRKGGLETVQADAEGGAPSWLMPAVVVGAVAAVAAGYIYWNQESADSVTGDAPLEPLSYSELRGYLRDKNADGAASELFETSDAVDTLAESATGSGPQQKAEALTSAIRDRAEAGAFVRWSFEQPRTTPPKPASWVAEKLAEEDGENLYPLELVAAAVAALREADVPAMVAEAWSFPGDRVPPDPSGHVGYFVVAVYDGEVGEGDPTLYDPYGGRSTQPDADSYRVLTDTQAVAAFWNLMGLHQFVHEGNPQRALEHVQRALSIDPRSPSIRTVRGAILLASGGGMEGIEELRDAAQIRGDSPRRVWVAVTYLDSDPEQANREVAAALEAHPDFAFAHATLGAIYLSQSELEQAREELVTAERLDPHLRNLPLTWAQYHLFSGNREQAAEKALQAVERQPQMWPLRIQVARILKEAGDYEGMRTQSRAALELVDDDRREVIREQILQLVGPTALDEPLEEILDGEDLGTDLGGGGEFQLDSDLLGSGSPSTEDPGGPSLLDEELGGDGPGLMLGDPSNLRLRDPSNDFQLRLNN